MSDIFQEVEEDVRRERYEQLWKKYGNYIIAAAVILVLAVAGYQAWSAYDVSQRQQVSDQYQEAQTIAAGGDAAKAEAQFAELSKSGYFGYATLSKFNLVSAYLAQGKRDPAIALLHELTESSDEAAASVARLRLAWAEADAKPRAEIEVILQPLTVAENPWRFAANEVLAYVELRAGSRAQAEADYLSLSQEPQAAPGLRQRAAAMLQYLKANPASGVPVSAGTGAAAPTPAVETPSPAAAAPASKAAPAAASKAAPAAAPKAATAPAPKAESAPASKAAPAPAPKAAPAPASKTAPTPAPKAAPAPASKASPAAAPAPSKGTPTP
jgi:hypothetical protein